MSDTETITVDQLSATVTRVIRQHIDEVNGKIQTDLTDVAAKTRSILSQRGGSPWRTGAYARSWAVKKEKTTLRFSVVVHNRQHYQLTHLLELGHGGPAPAGAHVHIRTAYERGVAELLAKMR